jgi:diguanylate cyclase (GGDEF)-like protein
MYVMSNTSELPSLPITDAREFLALVDAVLDRPSERHSPVVAAANRPLAVAVADLDRFGDVNARLGMEAGDRVLATFERTLAGSLPPDVVIARIGGDEYAIALPGTSAESALIQLEEVRTHYVAHGVEGVDDAVDASFGIAARPPHAEDAADVLRCAAEALMRAKREGSGRSVIYIEEKMTMKSSYFSRATLDRLSKLSAATSRTEASLLREALDDLLTKHRDKL